MIGALAFLSSAPWKIGLAALAVASVILAVFAWDNSRLNRAREETRQEVLREQARALARAREKVAERVKQEVSSDYQAEINLLNDRLALGPLSVPVCPRPKVRYVTEPRAAPDAGTSEGATPATGVGDEVPEPLDIGPGLSRLAALADQYTAELRQWRRIALESRNVCEMASAP